MKNQRKEHRNGNSRFGVAHRADDELVGEWDMFGVHAERGIESIRRELSHTAAEQPGMFVRTLTHTDLVQLRRLAEIAAAEGFEFLHRLVADLESGDVRTHDTGGFFLCAERGSEIVGLGGLTPDPYTTDEAVGRIRHLYVLPAARRQGLGGQLLREIEARGQKHYRTFSLRTDTMAAARFYEAMGYLRVHEPNTTHLRHAFAPIGRET